MPPKVIEMCNELELIARLAKQDKQAFTIIYNRYAEQLFYHALKYVKSSELAEDAVQDVFVKLWNQSQTLEINYSLQAYLFRSIQNHLLNVIKRGKLQARVLELVTPEDETSNCTEEVLQLKETAGEAQRAIDGLPPQRKLIFELSRTEGMTHRQIADHLEIAHSTVNNQMVKAIKSIKHYLTIRGSFGILVAVIATIPKF
jgi:RNA polymerase sigma-70 factor (family 1)